MGWIWTGSVIANISMNISYFSFIIPNGWFKTKVPTWVCCAGVSAFATSCMPAWISLSVEVLSVLEPAMGSEMN